MSKAIYVCSRKQIFGPSDEGFLHRICQTLEPDNVVTPVHHKVVVSGKTAYAVMNHQPSVTESGGSLLLGCLFDENCDWSKPKAEFPDGSYALFRGNEDFLEVVADPVASRTVWYYLDDDQFVASTSQRAMATYLGNFEFDDAVIPWVLSTGTLGPELSWDKRFTRLQVDSSVLLDRDSWSLTIREKPVIFRELDRSENEHRSILNDAILETIRSLKSVNVGDWVLPLSGGYDSRGILCFSKLSDQDREPLQTITWGLEESLHEAGNDAQVARDLAAAIGTKHSYYHTDISDESPQKIIDRFLYCGEGRIDHLSGYMDGMRIWRDLLQDGVFGVIRGDEGFGWYPVSSPLTVRYHVGCSLCSDFNNLKGVLEKYDLPAQELPARMQQKQESLAAWRDRLYHTFRLPTLLAALSDIKLSYVEQINPLLSGRILKRVREMPDGLRTDKHLFKQIVDAISPPVPYADKDANSLPQDILRKGPIVEVLRNTIESDYSKRLFNPDFLEFILKGIVLGAPSPKSKSVSLKKKIALLIPGFIKNFLRDSGASPLQLDPNKLAFRVYIIIRMHQILSQEKVKR